MPDSARFLRQIHPTWKDEEAVVAKIAFLPTPKDHDKLSGDDGNRTTPREAYARYVGTPGRLSSCVYGLSDGECTANGCPVMISPTDDNPYHIHLDFATLNSKGEKQRLAKRLRDLAVTRGQLYAPVS